MAWQVAGIKHFHNRLATVHGLDFGIPAEMTAFPACPDLCIKTSAPRGNASLGAPRPEPQSGIASVFPRWSVTAIKLSADGVQGLPW